MSDIKVLALDLDGTLTNSQKIITPRTRAALDAAMAKGVTVVLASGRPTVGIQPLAEELSLAEKGGCILSYNGGTIVDCKTGAVLYQQRLDPALIPELCSFARSQNVTILTYDDNGIVTEHPEDKWAQIEGNICKIPLQKVEDLAKYVDYPICKMLIALDPERIDHVEPLAAKRFEGRLGVYRSCAYFIELVPLGIAKDASLRALMHRFGLHRENLMACGDGMNDASMLRYAGVGVAMQNADKAVKWIANYVTENDNDHDGVAEAIEKFILNA